jgi:DNA-binding protein HU-beta
MNKQELIDAISKESKLSKATSKKALESLTKTVKKTLKKGDKVILVGYGTFSVVKRAARMGKNPRTGQTIKIPAKKAVKFKAGAELAKSVQK